MFSQILKFCFLNFVHFSSLFTVFRWREEVARIELGETVDQSCDWSKTGTSAKWTSGGLQNSGGGEVGQDRRSRYHRG